MNYMVLAAGRGSRMGNLSSYLQKCMYPVIDRPFLELTLDSLVSNARFDAAKDRIILVVGHLQEQIRAYFGSNWKGLELQYVHQTEALGTAHAVALGYQACVPDCPVIIVQADVWAEPVFFENLVDHPVHDVLSICRHECAFQHNERVNVDHGMITRAWKGTSPFVECGIWKFSPDMIGFMMSRKDDEYRALASVQAAIESGRQVAAIERGTWIHLGGTEPGVAENLIAVVEFFQKERQAWL